MNNKKGALILSFFILILPLSCSRDAAEIPVVPPPTPPLSRSVIGYGVIGASYTHVTAEPSAGGLSLGYLRRGAIVAVLERRSISSPAEGNLEETVESWVFVSPAEGEGAYRGWLRESLVQIYANLSQAKTAAQGFSQ
jgi:hypothetical protein